MSDDYVGIDQGPILVAIENARSGLIWKLFMRHPMVIRALQRLEMPVPAATLHRSESRQPFTSIQVGNRSPRTNVSQRF